MFDGHTVFGLGEEKGFAKMYRQHWLVCLRCSCAMIGLGIASTRDDAALRRRDFRYVVFLSGTELMPADGSTDVIFGLFDFKRCRAGVRWLLVACSRDKL